MARGDDLEDLSSKELSDLLGRINTMISDRRVAEQRSVKDQLTALAAEAGFSIDEVLGFGKKGRGVKKGVAATQYQNPDNPDQTWAGRGRKPNWLNEKLKKRGAKIEDFAI